jgi:hypothetical protein
MTVRDMNNSKEVVKTMKIVKKIGSNRMIMEEIKKILKHKTNQKCLKA